MRHAIMMNHPELYDMGEMHWTQDELREYNDPGWENYPDGLSVHPILCIDCGAETRDGQGAHIVHHAECTPGRAKKWADYYAQEKEDE